MGRGVDCGSGFGRVTGDVFELALKPVPVVRQAICSTYSKCRAFGVQPLE